MKRAEKNNHQRATDFKVQSFVEFVLPYQDARQQKNLRDERNIRAHQRVEKFLIQSYKSTNYSHNEKFQVNFAKMIAQFEEKYFRDE